MYTTGTKTAVTNLSEPCLSAFLAQLSADPTFALSIESLEISSEQPTTEGLAALEANAAHRSTAADDDDDYDGLDAYRALWDAHTRTLETDADVTLLAAALARLANLRAVRVEASSRRACEIRGSPSGAVMTDWVVVRGGGGEYAGEQEVSSYEMARAVWVVLGAVARSGRGIDAFGTSVGAEACWCYPTDGAFDVGDGVWRVLGGVWSGVRVLEVGLDLMPFGARARAGGGPPPAELVARLLGLSCGLEELFTVFRNSDVGSLLPVMRYPGLRRLELYDFSCVEEDLFAVVKAHSKTLRQVCFGAACFTAGDWRSFLQRFSELLIRESVPLEELYLRELAHDLSPDGSGRELVTFVDDDDRKWGWNVQWCELCSVIREGNAVGSNRSPEMFYLKGQETIREALPHAVRMLKLNGH